VAEEALEFGLPEARFTQDRAGRVAELAAPRRRCAVGLLPAPGGRGARRVAGGGRAGVWASASLKTKRRMRSVRPSVTGCRRSGPGDRRR